MSIGRRAGEHLAGLKRLAVAGAQGCTESRQERMDLASRAPVPVPEVPETISRAT